MHAAATPPLPPPLGSLESKRSFLGRGALSSSHSSCSGGGWKGGGAGSCVRGDASAKVSSMSQGKGSLATMSPAGGLRVEERSS